MPKRARTTEFSLYTPDGSRKYLGSQERLRFIAATSALNPNDELLALTLAWTGARASELLSVTASSFDIRRCVVAVQTLKRRKHCVREIPVPPWLMARLDSHFRLTERQSHGRFAHERIWSRHRATLWRIVKRVMVLSQVIGRAACPRGLRHTFAIDTLRAGVPLNMTQKWMGHACISTTAIYADACGPEEIALATRYWEMNARVGPPRPKSSGAVR